MCPGRVRASLISGQVCLVSAADRLVGEVGRCGFVLGVTAGGGCGSAAVEAGDEPERPVDSRGAALAPDQGSTNAVTGGAAPGDGAGGPGGGVEGVVGG